MRSFPARLDVHDWIDTPEALSHHFRQAPTRIGLDTEFVRERTYWPKLALVQIGLEAEDGPRALLVDPLAPGMAQALRKVLADTSTLKVMHSAGEDLLALKHACDSLPTPLFDTQTAAALAGMAAGISYQKLVQHSTGITLEKGQTRSNWLQRPLSAAQCRYAAEDVLHLPMLHQRLAARLHALGRSHWLAQDCTRALANAENDAGERWPHLPLRQAQALDAAAQRRLLRLLRWRDQHARNSDHPRSWILDNTLALTLAQHPPTDPAALQAMLETTPKAPRKLGQAIWQALTTPLADEADAPPIQVQDLDRQALRQLQHAVATLSAELELPASVLAPRRWLEKLLDDDSRWPDALAGWRRQLLEPRLRPILSEAGITPPAPV